MRRNVPLDEVIAEMPLEEQAEVAAKTERLRDEYLTLQQLRRAARMTQDELAAKLELSQASISKLEKRAALAKIATLRAYVEGLGGTLDLAITLPDREVPIMLALEDIDEAA